MNKSIPCYHISYSDEENRIVHNFVENATESELVSAIRELANVSAEQVPNINEAFKQFEKEIRERDILYQKYKALESCLKEWKKYYTGLCNYKIALRIRKEYAIFKGTYKGKSVFNDFIDEKQSTCFPGYSCDFVHLAILSEDAKNSIKKPVEPDHLYFSTDDIEVCPLSNDASLESIGKDNLKYLLIFMLARMDSPNENQIPTALLFFTRKYAQENHKGKNALPPFATSLLTYDKLITENRKFLTNIKETADQCREILAEIEN